MGEVIRKTYKGRFVGWYLRYIDADGRRKQRASHQPSHADAKRKLAELEALISRRRAGLEPLEQAEAQPDAPQRMRVAELFDRFGSEYVDPELKDREKYLYHARSVLRRIRRLAPEFCRLPIVEVQPRTVARLRDALGRRYPAGTVRATLIQLSAAFSWAIQEGLLEKNPLRGVSQPKAPPPSDEWLEPEEVRRLLDTAAATAARGLLWKSRHAAVALGVYLGLRLGEIYGLRWRDIDWQTGRVSVARSYAALPKSGRVRHLKMPPPLREVLSAWRPHCPETPEGVIVPVCWNRSWRMSNPAAAPRGLPTLLKLASCRPLKRPWHALRHTFASNYLRQGGSLAVLQRLLGHAEIRTTMIYAHLAADYLDGEMERVRY